MSTRTDSGWAWVVLAVSTFNLLLLGAMSISIGLFQTAFLSHFHGNTALVSLACSLCASLQCLLGPLSSVLCNWIGMRYTMMLGTALLSLGLFASSFVSSLAGLIFCYGVVAGSGFGTLYTPCFVLVGHYFDKKRVLANGIALSAAGIGLTVGPHLIGWLIDQSGWRGALVVFSCIIAQMAVTSSLVFPLRRKPNQDPLLHSDTMNKKWEERSSRKYSKLLCLRNIRNMKSPLNLRIIKNYAFWLLMVQVFLLMLIYSIQIVHFPSYVLTVGVDSSNTPSILTAFGVSIILSRLIGSVVFTKLAIDIVYSYIVLIGLFGVAFGTMPFYARGVVGLLCYEVLVGVSYGSGYSLLTPLVVELFGVDHLATVVGYLLALGGLAAFVGPPLAGAIYDLTSSYSVGFHVGGLLSLLGTALLLVIPVRRKRRARPDQTEKEVDLDAEQCDETNTSPLKEHHSSEIEEFNTDNKRSTG